MNRGNVMFGDYASVFPTDVGMNRIRVEKQMTLGGIPHGCGDEPNHLAEKRDA